MKGRTQTRPAALSLVLGVLLTMQITSGLLPVVPSAGAKTIQRQFSPTDVLSGGVWSRLNNFDQNLTVLTADQLNRRSSTSSLNSSSTILPPSGFTGNFRVTTNGTMFPQENEPSIAASNATGRPLLVVGANSLSKPNMVSYYSKDQGSNWIGPTYLPLSNSSDKFASDPALGTDSTGTLYYSFLSLGYSVLGGLVDDLVVATSTDGQNWTEHVAVHRWAYAPPNRNSSNFVYGALYDKDYMAVGRSVSGPWPDAAYVTYTDFVSYCSNVTFLCYQNSTIMATHSNDGGVTWSKPVAVSPSIEIPQIRTGRIVQGSMPAVAPNGDLYVAYYDSGSDGWLNGSASIMIAKSVDGGNSFSAPRQAAYIPQELTYYSNGGFRWWSSMFPSMDVAPDGTVYITYCAKQNSATKDPSDVYLVSSTDGGVAWSRPTKVNDDSTQNGQFFPWLKVSADGVVHIIWGDQRLDPIDKGYDVFYAQATNHGTTVSPNSRVTDVGTDPKYTNGFVGDYFNVAVLGNQVYAAWTDGRRGLRPLGREFLTGNTDIFMARLGPKTPYTLSFGTTPPGGYIFPVMISGRGLPRDAFFTMKMNGTGILSQKSGTAFFFTDDGGSFSDVVVPNSDYFGSYVTQADDWVSGLPFAQTSLVLVDTRGLQISVTGPTIGFPGENVTWNVQIVSAGGSPSRSASIISAELILPNGSTIDLLGAVTSTGTGSYSISSTLPNSALPGSYTLLVDATQASNLVKSAGSGSSTLTISGELIGIKNAANSAVQQLNQALDQLGKEQNYTQSVLQQLGKEQTYTLVVGAIAVVAVVLEAVVLLRKRG